MATRLLLLLCLSGHVFSKEPPDVDCWVIHLEHVNCSWNKQGTPDVNYTFYSWFQGDEKNCTTYVSENSMNTGCIQPYDELLTRRFLTFHTRLSHGNKTCEEPHELKENVLLYPPINLTVKNGSDYNLWFYWNQTAAHCAASEVRFRVNDKNWENSSVSIGTQEYCINLPSSSSRYELQVKSRVGKDCGESSNWSSWSEPAVWGSNNSIGKLKLDVSVSTWTPLLYVVAAVVLILFVVMLVPNERLRIIPIPVIPKPSLVLYDIEDWPQFSKGLKGNLSYNEHACPVREYCHVSESDSDSSDGSTCSVTTDQTDCSVSIAVNNADDLSTSAGLLSSQEEEQVSV
ncbi:cytokine receptor common subunit gamma-like [Hippoglossus hippoglossus]|uniref:cytokine receptor common subunit gamma-like n=1 Tax=Hippoglossus hippoglossus TaxID=8267 RepID=UPI00148C4FF2|nr:cytokine receptor common subunit gamma-like [Hippoglossus hippoglossus]